MTAALTVAGLIFVAFALVWFGYFLGYNAGIDDEKRARSRRDHPTTCHPIVTDGQDFP